MQQVHIRVDYLVSNLSIKKDNLIMKIDSKFKDGEKIISDTFNATFLNDDIYIIHILSNSISSMSFLIERFKGSYTASVIQSRGLTSTLILDNDGVNIFGNVFNITGLEIYKIKI